MPMCSDHHISIRDIATIAAVALALARTGSATTSAFEAALTYDAPAPKTVLSADFNGDGSPDLFSSGDELLVYLNQGNGLFGPTPSWTMAEAGEGAVLADFNDDGIPDVAIERGTQSILVLLGVGNGTFTVLSPIEVSGETREIAVGDFDGNTIDDLVVTTDPSGVDHFTVLISDGTGGFSEIFEVPASGSSLRDLTVTDFELDGYDDLVVRPEVFASDVLVVHNLTNGVGADRFGEQLITGLGEAVRSMAVVPVTADPYPDIVIATDTDLAYVENNGFGLPGMFLPLGVSLIAQPRALVPWDFDGDGDTDFLLRMLSFPHGVVRNDGAGTYVVQELDVLFQFPQDYDIADFNGDSKDDILITGGDGVVTTIFGDSPLGLVPETVDFPAGSLPRSAVTSDFDGDGDIDIAVANDASGHISIHQNSGGGYFLSVSRASGGPFSPTGGGATGDFDLDGLPEIAITYADPGRMTIFKRNAQSAQFTALYTAIVATEPTEISSADLDGDSLLDLVFLDDPAGPTANVVFQSGNGDSTFGSLVYTAVSGEVQGLSLGDIDADGDVDVLLVDRSSTEVLILENSGTAALSASPTVTVGANPWDTALGDFNGDDALDLVAVRRASSENVAIFLSTGGGSFSAPTLLTAGDGPQAVAVADIDRDGHADIAVGCANDQSLSVFMNLGDGTFGAPSTVDIDFSPADVAASDFNADGWIDVTAIDPSADSVALVLNDGMGSLQPPQTFLAGPGLSHLAVSDLDADADPDIVAIGGTAGLVSLLFSTGAAPQAVRALLLESGTADGVAQAGEMLALRFDLEVAGPSSDTLLQPFDLFAIDGAIGQGSNIVDSAAMRTDVVVSLAGASTEITASTTQIDVGGSLRPGLITAALSSADAQDSGIVNINDTAVETLSAVGPMSTPIVSATGGTATVSSDSARFFFTGHALEVPPGGLADDMSVTLGPPSTSIYAALPLPEAVAITTSEGAVSFEQPATLTLEYDPAAAPGQPESLFRVFQIGETSPGVLGAVPLDPSTQILDADTNELPP